MKKTFSLTDKKEMLELMKQLYSTDEVCDAKEETDNTKRETGANLVSRVAQLPPNCS